MSCDSMQVYQTLNIVTNKPSIEEMKGIPHYVMDCVALTQTFDVVQFEHSAKAHIDDVFARRKVPVVVGGTGMYMKVLLDGIFEGPQIDVDIRKQLEYELSEKGCGYLHQELNVVDPEAAQKIHPNDARRIIRALEVYRQTGTPISTFQQTTKGLWGRYDIRIFGLALERERLYQRIDERVDKMFDRGLIDEICSIMGIALSQTAQAIIGIKEVSAYISGECSLEQAKQEMKKNTRRLAKRQLTWFRAEKRLKWVDISTDESLEDTVQRVLNELGDYGE